VIYSHLFERVQGPATVRAALIGAGNFGTPIVTQAPLIPRLDLSVVADVDVKAGKKAFRQAGFAEKDIIVCEERGTALRALERGKKVVLQNALELMDLPLDVIASATRSPEAGALYAREAIHHGKHVVMIDKEADSVVGPMLKYLADRAEVVYTTDDGDQPGLLMGLVAWARELGLGVLCGGNMHGCLYDRGNSGATATLTNRAQITVPVPETECWALEPIPAGEASRFYQARHSLVTSWRPAQQRGDPICHLVVSANGTGLLPCALDKGTIGYRPVVRLSELPEVLSPTDEGGILDRRGALDIPVVLHTAHEPDVDGGVYIVVANADDRSRSIMIRKGLIANSRGTAMLMYRPHHLCGAETAMSILCAGLLGVPTGSATVLPLVDMIAIADRDWEAGEWLGGAQATEGPINLGYHPGLGTVMVPGFPVVHGDGGHTPVPFFMLEGCRLVKDVPCGTTITADMVEQPAGSVLWQLREEQDAQFAGCMAQGTR
jgi:predicted homoserine dehydrogenase-like protein